MYTQEISKLESLFLENDLFEIKNLEEWDNWIEDHTHLSSSDTLRLAKLFASKISDHRFIAYFGPRLKRGHPRNSVWLRIIHLAMVNGGNKVDSSVSWINWILPLSDIENQNEDIARLSSTCLGSCCVNSRYRLDGDSFKKLYDHILGNIKKVIFAKDSQYKRGMKLLSSHFRTLQILLNENRNLVNTYSLETLSAAIETIFNQKTDTSFRNYIISDSDMSEVENLKSDSSKVLTDHDKARINLSYFLKTMIQANSKCSANLISDIFPYTRPTKVTFLSMLSSPIFQMRKAASETLFVMFEHWGNIFLAALDNSSKPSNYVSYGEKIASIIYQINVMLVKSLRENPDNFILFTTLEKFIYVTPYDRLSLDLISPIMGMIINFLSQYGDDIKLNALDTLWALLDNCKKIKNFKPIIDGLSAEGVLFGHIVSSSYSQDTRIRLSALKSLYFSILVIGDISPNHEKAILSAIHKSCTLANEDSLELISEIMALLLTNADKMQYFNFNNSDVDKILHCMVTSDSQNSRMHAYQIISTIQVETLENMVHGRKKFFWFLLFSGFQDESSDVRTQSFRCLGLWAEFKEFSQSKTVENYLIPLLVDKLENEIPQVRIRVAWAAANLSDYWANITGLEHNLSSLFNLLLICIRCCQNQERIKANMLRAVGNIISLLPLEEVLSKKNELLFDEAWDLIVCSVRKGHMKTQWNGCRVLGNLIDLSKIPLGLQGRRTQEILESLCKALESSPNYKVRIAACVSLYQIKSREDFFTPEGDYFFNVIAAVYSVVNNSYQIGNSSSSKRQDSLGNLETRYSAQLKEDTDKLLERLMGFMDESERIKFEVKYVK